MVLQGFFSLNDADYVMSTYQVRNELVHGQSAVTQDELQEIIDTLLAILSRPAFKDQEWYEIFADDIIKEIKEKRKNKTELKTGKQKYGLDTR